jgi:uncharacterized protein YbjT (DUF2867 family)
MKLVVLGASGSLGRAVTQEAERRGHAVTRVSRRDARDGSFTYSTAEPAPARLWGDADAILDATNALANPQHALVDGTRDTLAKAAAEGARHFVGISIVGIDDAPPAYYRVKVAQEKTIEAGGVPWSLLRATQFHDLIPRFARGTLGVCLIPRGWQLQPIDVREVATVLIYAAEAGPRGRLPDVGGPEVIPFADLARGWHRAVGLRRLRLVVPVPGALGAFLRSGKLCCPDRKVGKRTFAEWLAEQGARP